MQSNLMGSKNLFYFFEIRCLVWCGIRTSNFKFPLFNNTEPLVRGASECRNISISPSLSKSLNLIEIINLFHGLASDVAT